MFSKKPRRNFRQRKDESSEEDEGDNSQGARGEAESALQSSKLLNVARRGISCSSKPSASPPPRATESDSSGAEEEQEVRSCSVQTKSQKEQHSSSNSNTLSFQDEKDDECDFKVKRSATKAVFFQARKKEESPVKVPHQQGAKVVDLNKHSEQSEGSNSSSAEDAALDSDNESDSADSNFSKSSPEQKGASPPAIKIPDAKKIRAAKEQRRRARAQKDYIPLDGDRESTPGSGDGNEEQSDREQDSDDEPDDHQRRIQFAPKSKTLRERMAEKMGDDEESWSDSEEEEDQQLWEEYQIAKGVKKHQKQSESKPKKLFVIPEIPPVLGVDVIKRKITLRLQSIKEVHRAREAELRRILEDLESSKTAVENIENYKGDEQHLFYRRMNLFSHDLLDCLSEKIESINRVELDMHSLYIDQAEALLSQRREVVQKESTRLQQLTYSTYSNNTEALENTSSPKDGEHLEEDYGTVPADLEQTAEQETELQSKRADILKRSQEIFADVHEDFFDVRRILSRFDGWRVSFPETYTNAYIGLCLPKLLAPYIRHQITGWNPLKAEGEDFEAFPWYSAVENFCHGQGYEELENSDKNLLPAIVEKTILSKIQGFVELVWDPASSQQSRCLASLCKRIQEDYSVFDGEQTKPVKAFIEAVTQRLRSAVDNDVFIPIYPKTYLEDKTSQQFQFQNQQFWFAVKLLGNMALWDGLIAQNVLQELMLDKLLNRYLMMTLLNESNPKCVIHKCQKVADCFPESWFVDLSTGSSLPQLLTFTKHLDQTANLLGKDKDAAKFRSLLSDVIKLFQKIKASESLKVLAETYSCQDQMKSLLT